VLGIWVLAGAAVGAMAVGGFGLFCRLEGREPIREFFLEMALRRQSLQELDSLAFRKDRSNLIVGLTTIPSRLPYLAPTLKSLLIQDVLPQKVLLHIPTRSRREGVEYQIPEEIKNLKVIEIVRCSDLGPSTKILPALLNSDSGQPIVSVDDDRIYRRTFLGGLMAASHSYPDAAVGCIGLRAPLDRVDRRKGFIGRTVDGLRFGRGVSLRGSRLSRNPLPVDILHGYGGVLVRPEFFDLMALADLEGAPEAAWWEDDTWFAAHCHAPKLIVPGRPGSFPRFFRRSVYSASRLGSHNRGGADPELRNTTVLMRMFSDRWSA